MTQNEFGRTLNQARIEQGFKTQEQLDAFYRSHDHKQGCAVCQQVGGFVPLDDGMQPYLDECAEGRALRLASFA